MELDEYYKSLEPYLLKSDNSKSAILILHGLSGSPTEHRGLAEYLFERGFTVYCPLLSGHGTSEYDMKKYSHKDWLIDGVIAFEKLHSEYENVSVIGHSMGGLLATNIAAKYRVNKLVLLAPAYLNSMTRIKVILPFGKYFIRWYQLGRGKSPTQFKKPYKPISYPKVSTKSLHDMFKLIKLTKSASKKVLSPTLLLQGEKDQLVPVHCSKELFELLGTTQKRRIIYPNSGHGLSAHVDREVVWKDIYKFLRV